MNLQKSVKDCSNKNIQNGQEVDRKCNQGQSGRPHERKRSIKVVAKDHLKSLVRSSTCLVILDFLHFTPLVLIGKKIFFFSETRSKTRSGDL